MKYKIHIGAEAAQGSNVHTGIDPNCRGSEQVLPTARAYLF